MMIREVWKQVVMVYFLFWFYVTMVQTILNKTFFKCTHITFSFFSYYILELEACQAWSLLLEAWRSEDFVLQTSAMFLGQVFDLLHSVK
mgnify:CR=1 FL=1